MHCSWKYEFAQEFVDGKFFSLSFVHKPIANRVCIAKEFRQNVYRTDSVQAKNFNSIVVAVS